MRIDLCYKASALASSATFDPGPQSKRLVPRVPAAAPAELRTVIDFDRQHLGTERLLALADTHLAASTVSTAELLADIAEIEDRRIHLNAGHPTMYAWCVARWQIFHDAAYRRVKAARTAREYPIIFQMVADGRLHLTAILMLTPYLTPANAGELLEAAAGKTKAALEHMLAARFPGTEALPLITSEPGTASLSGTPPTAAPAAPDTNPSVLRPGATSDVTQSSQKFAPERIGPDARNWEPGGEATGRAVPSATPRVPSVAPVARLAPIARERYVLQLTIARHTQEKLRRAQKLLSHQVPAGDLAAVLDRALDALIGKLEKRKFAVTRGARGPRRRDAAGKAVRTIPAHVRRAVVKRDGGQCTYVSPSGHRCGSRRWLEFDHAVPVARGGRSTVENLRLRCRAHNQYEADRVFGAAFMNDRRARARDQGTHAGQSNPSAPGVGPTAAGRTAVDGAP